MGSKNNPGKFDCYANAEPDEPMFVLLGRDPCAAEVVRFWIALREKMSNKTSVEKLDEARTCAASMTQWANENGKTDLAVEAVWAARDVYIETARGAR